MDLFRLTTTRTGGKICWIREEREENPRNIPKAKNTGLKKVHTYTRLLFPYAVCSLSEMAFLPGGFGEHGGRDGP